jgi:hypothetical protein
MEMRDDRRLPLLGTKRTTGKIRSSVAIGGITDMARAAHFGSEWPEADIDSGSFRLPRYTSVNPASVLG